MNGRARRGSDCGTTLVETMIALGIMGIVMAIATATMLMSQQATNRLDRSIAAIDSARLLSAELDRELRSAVCISSPGENQSSNTLSFQSLAASEVIRLTYTVASGAVTRTDNVGASRTVITGVGATTTAFRQLTTPLRTVVVNIPIRSANGGQFNLQTTIAGRNAWRSC